MKHLSLTLLLISFACSAFGQNIYTFAGTANSVGGYAGVGVLAPLARFNRPNGLAADKMGNVYIADCLNDCIRKVDVSGIITVYAAPFNHPEGIVLDTAGNLYVADQSDNKIKRVDAITGAITTIAGNGLQGYSGDGGLATSASLYWPSAIAINPVTGEIYFSDTYNNVIRKVSTLGIITTVIGNHSSGTGYGGDGGPAVAASFYYPQGLTFDGSGNLYIADANNYVVRKVNTSGIISTFAGTHLSPGYAGDGGPAIAASLWNVSDVKIDGSGNVFIADQSSRIRKVNNFGIISTYAGSYSTVYSGDGGPATAAGMSYANNIAIDSANNMYISCDDVNVVRRVGAAVTGINITSNTGNTVCANTLTYFTATPVADTMPHYQWEKNGLYVGTDNPIYTPSSFAINDKINCLLYNGVGDTLANSNLLTVDSLKYIGPLVTQSTYCVGSIGSIYCLGMEIFSDDFVVFNVLSSDSGILKVYNNPLVGEQAIGIFPGIDTVYFTATNVCGTDTTRAIITVVPNIFTPITGSDSLCAGESFTFTDLSAGGIWSTLYPGYSAYNIDSLSGVFISSNSTYGPVLITYGTPGCFVVDTVTIEKAPISAAIIGPSLVVVGATVTYSNDTAGGIWSVSNTALATVDTHTGLLSGLSAGFDTLYYTTTNAAGCNYPNHRIIHVIAGPESVSSINNTASFTVYPNPANGNLNITWAAQSTGNGTVTISDVSGRTVYKSSIEMGAANQARLDISTLKAGVYMISIQSGNGYYCSKLVVGE